jgi:hypothetical protein
LIILSQELHRKIPSQPDFMKLRMFWWFVPSRSPKTSSRNMPKARQCRFFGQFLQFGESKYFTGTEFSPAALCNNPFSKAVGEVVVVFNYCDGSEKVIS